MLTRLLACDLTRENYQATAVVDRMRRAIAATSDSVSARLMPIATTLGRAFGVDDWYVELFAEEVVRGGPAFAVSLVLSAIEPALRASAELGAWQLISPGDAVGRVVVVAGLHEVQDEVRGAFNAAERWLFSLCPAIRSRYTLACDAC